MGKTESLMKNFPFEHNGSIYWYSRSIVVSTYVFCKDVKGNWCVLAAKRGPGCPSSIGKWNVPGGYLDFNETTEQGAKREIWEETGLDLRKGNKLNLIHIESSPYPSLKVSRLQHVKYTYYYVLKGITDCYELTDSHSEPQEIDEIKWIPIQEINNITWAYNQDLLVKRIFTNYINCSFITKFINNIKQEIMRDYIK